VTGWIIAPILLPAVTAPFLVLALRRAPKLQRRVSLVATGLLLAVAVVLYWITSDGVIRPYLLGAWPAPFGIVLVLDRLSATMLLLSAVLAMCVAVYAADGWDTKGHHFHPLFQFQLMGINGAFLTGDIFNLFVFFEVMLIASYGLMLHGGGARRLAAGFQYVSINLLASSLFLVGIGVIYAVTGTLNMADLAVKVRQIDPGDAALLRTGALLLLAVFATKAALVPLHWWLPTAYAAAPAPAAALFAILTKVGAYSIIRVFTLVFGADGGAAAGMAGPWILWAAVATLAIGSIGALSSRSLATLVCFSVVWSMGSLLVAVSSLEVRGLTAALYYALHSTLISAALFLLADQVAARRGAWGDRLVAAPPAVQAGLMGGLFFMAAIAMAGLPPLSGFLGKLMILQASRAAAPWPWIWTMLLLTSIVVVLAYSRAGSVLFWKSEGTVGEVGRAGPLRTAPVAATAFLLVGTALLTVFAGPVTRHLEAAAQQLVDTAGYVEAVLGPPLVTQTTGR
jgi:multicomponent K+:H+ antiporter subunit D